MFKFNQNQDKTFAGHYKFKESGTVKFDSGTAIPIKQWVSLTITQEKQLNSYYKLNTFFGSHIVHTMTLTTAPIWQASLNVYATNPWNSVADGFVREFKIYKKNPRYTIY